MARAGLTIEKIAAFAENIADHEGLAAVTLARLANTCGVRPPSLYKHVDGLDGLLRLLTLRGLGEANARLQRAAIGKSGRDALLALAEAYWRFAREQPGLYAASLRPLQAGDRDLAAAGDTLLGTVNAALAEYRLSSDDLLHASRGFRALVHGFVSLNATGGFRLGRDLDETLLRLIDTFDRDLAARGAITRPPPASP